MSRLFRIVRWPLYFFIAAIIVLLIGMFGFYADVFPIMQVVFISLLFMTALSFIVSVVWHRR